MATIEINIPDEYISLIVEAYKSKMVQADAADIENPTGAEILKVVKRHWAEVTKIEVDIYREKLHREQFTPTDLEMT